MWKKWPQFHKLPFANSMRPFINWLLLASAERLANSNLSLLAVVGFLRRDSVKWEKPWRWRQRRKWFLISGLIIRNSWEQTEPSDLFHSVSHLCTCAKVVRSFPSTEVSVANANRPRSFISTAATSERDSAWHVRWLLTSASRTMCVSAHLHRRMPKLLLFRTGQKEPNVLLRPWHYTCNISPLL